MTRPSLPKSNPLTRPLTTEPKHDSPPLLAHPETVGESYWEHFGVASRFGAEMLAGGCKATVHAIFPNMCTTSASDTIRKLHTIMVEKRGAKRDATVEMLSIEWVI